MLLQSIYYGKTPILRAYRNNIVIWGINPTVELPISGFGSSNTYVVAELSDGVAQILKHKMYSSTNSYVTAGKATCTETQLIGASRGVTDVDLWVQQVLPSDDCKLSVDSMSIITDCNSEPIKYTEDLHVNTDCLLIGQELLPAAKYNMRIKSRTVVNDPEAVSMQYASDLRILHVAEFWSQDLMPSAKTEAHFSSTQTAHSQISHNAELDSFSRMSHYADFWSQQPMPAAHCTSNSNNTSEIVVRPAEGIECVASAHSSGGGLLLPQKPLDCFIMQSVSNTISTLREGVPESVICDSKMYCDSYTVITRGAADGVLVNSKSNAQVFSRSISCVSKFEPNTQIEERSTSTADSTLSWTSPNTLVQARSSGGYSAVLSKESSWISPVQDGSSLYVRQAYSAVQDNTTLKIQ